MSNKWKVFHLIYGIPHKLNFPEEERQVSPKQNRCEFGKTVKYAENLIFIKILFLCH